MSSRFSLITLIMGVAALFYFGMGREPDDRPFPALGKPAPEFTVAAFDGKSFSSAELKGKITVLVFWATWCDACRANEPSVAELHRQFSSQAGFQLIGIATQDSLENIRHNLSSKKRAYLNLVDVSGRVAGQFGVFGLPNTFLLDAQGNIVAKIIGPINPRKLTEEITQLLDKLEPG